MTIHSLSGTHTLNDLRFQCKMMAQVLRTSRKLQWGNIPLRSLTDKVLEGDVTVLELERWMPIATKVLRKGKV